MFSSLGQRPFYEKSIKTKGKRRRKNMGKWMMFWNKKKRFLHSCLSLWKPFCWQHPANTSLSLQWRLSQVNPNHPTFTIITKIIQETVFDKNSIISTTQTTCWMKIMRSLMQRFATRPYTCDLDNLADKMVHLTNYRSFTSSSLLNGNIANRGVITCHHYFLYEGFRCTI